MRFGTVVVDSQSQLHYSADLPTSQRQINLVHKLNLSAAVFPISDDSTNHFFDVILILTFAIPHDICTKWIEIEQNYWDNRFQFVKSPDAPHTVHKIYTIKEHGLSLNYMLEVSRMKLQFF